MPAYTPPPAFVTMSPTPAPPSALSEPPLETRIPAATRRRTFFLKNSSSKKNKQRKAQDQRPPFLQRFTANNDIVLRVEHNDDDDGTATPDSPLDVQPRIIAQKTRRTMKRLQDERHAKLAFHRLTDTFPTVDRDIILNLLNGNDDQKKQSYEWVLNVLQLADRIQIAQLQAGAMGPAQHQEEFPEEHNQQHYSDTMIEQQHNAINTTSPRSLYLYKSWTKDASLAKQNQETMDDNNNDPLLGFTFGVPRRLTSYLPPPAVIQILDAFPNVNPRHIDWLLTCEQKKERDANNSNQQSSALVRVVIQLALEQEDAEESGIFANAPDRMSSITEEQPSVASGTTMFLQKHETEIVQIPQSTTPTQQTKPRRWPLRNLRPAGSKLKRPEILIENEIARPASTRNLPADADDDNFSLSFWRTDSMLQLKSRVENHPNAQEDLSMILQVFPKADSRRVFELYLSGMTVRAIIVVLGKEEQAELGASQPFAAHEQSMVGTM